MSDAMEPLGVRIEEILKGDDHYEKIAKLVWIIQEYTYQAFSTLAQKEEWAHDALKVALVAASNQYDNLHERYHQDLRKILDIWDERTVRERDFAYLEQRLKAEHKKNKVLRSKVKELRGAARLQAKYVLKAEGLPR